MKLVELKVLISQMPVEDQEKNIVSDEDYCDCMLPEAGDICHITIFRTETEEAYDARQ